MKLHMSGEDYLETILILEQSRSEVRAVDIAERMGVTKPSVSRALSILKNGGFLTIIDHSVRLTEVGREAAEEILQTAFLFQKSTGFRGHCAGDRRKRGLFNRTCR